MSAIRTGNLRGQVLDESAEVVSDATLTLTGTSTRQATSDSNGKFKFIGLDPGPYKLKAEREGYSTSDYPNVKVNLGKNVTLEIRLSSAIEDVITVTAESPMTDEWVVQNASNVEQGELEGVPRRADPWSVVTQAAGVLVAVNGGDSRLPTFTALGATSQDNVVTLDGGTALASTTIAGSAPDFSDLGAFEEVQVVTGGSDIANPTAGVQVNLVTRRGTNEWRGSGRYQLTPGEGPRRADPAPNGIDKIEEYGVEGGGLLFPDRLWGWGALGRRRLDLLAAGQLDATAIDSETYKLNAQLSESDSGLVSWKKGKDREIGRGAGLQRAREATWDQHASQRLWTGEESHVFGSDLYLTGSISGATENLELVPLGGGQALRDSSGVWRGGSYSLTSERRVEQFRPEVNWFFDLGSSGHELRLGGSLAREKVEAEVAWPGSGTISIQGESFGLGAERDVGIVTREGRPAAEVRTGGLWLQDTLTRGGLTASIGLRFDGQRGSIQSGSVEASPIRPDLLPALRFDGKDPDGPSWLDLSPRAGVTWGVGEERRTLLRASYGRFAERLSIERVVRTHPLSLASAYHFFSDSNGNQSLDPGELGALFFCDNCAAGNLGRPRATNRNDRSLEASLTDELTAGVEHTFRSGLFTSLTLVYRRLSRIPEERVLVAEGGQVRIATRGDYRLDGFVAGTLPDGMPYHTPFFALRPGLQPTGGTFLVNGDRQQEYRGVSLTFVRRLANQWMLRGQGTWSAWTWKVPRSFDAFDDPTDIEDPSDRDGAPVVERLSAPLGETGDWLGGRWSFDVSGLYQVVPDQPWGFDVAVRVAGQEGSPSPPFHRVVGSDGIVRDVAVADFDRFRERDHFTADLRLAKDLSFGSGVATLSLDTFNLFDRAPVLARERNQALPTVGMALAAALPRTFRFGVSIRYK